MDSIAENKNIYDKEWRRKPKLIDEYTTWGGGRKEKTSHLPSIFDQFSSTRNDFLFHFYHFCFDLIFEAAETIFCAHTRGLHEFSDNHLGWEDS